MPRKSMTIKKPVPKNTAKKKSEKAGVKADALVMEVVGIITIGMSLLLILSLFTSWTGALGASISLLLNGMLGAGSYFLPFIAILLSVYIIYAGKSFAQSRIILSTVLFLVIISLVHVVNIDEDNIPAYESIWKYIAEAYKNGGIKNGGLIGAMFGNVFYGLLDKIGSYIIFGIAIFCLLIFILGRTLSDVVRSVSMSAVEKVSRATAVGNAPQDGVSFKVKSIDKKKVEVYDYVNSKKSGKVFNHVLDDGASDGGEKSVELINDMIRRKAEKPDVFAFKPVPEPPKLPEREIDNSVPDISLFRKAEEAKAPPPKVSDTRVFESTAGDVPFTEVAEDTENTKIIELAEPEDEAKGIAFIGFDSGSGKKQKTASREDIGPPFADIEDEIGRAVELFAEDYKFPPIDLLVDYSTPPSMETKAQIMETSRKLEETLKSFGVEAKVVEVSRGPTVTRYELSPGMGVRVSKISVLSDDIALALAAQTVRIEAPVPGKSVIGIELPNKDPQMVSLREVIDDDQFRRFSSKLAFALGKDIAGDTIVTDIAKMPHLLIAGSTGSGKSVCINTLVTSIIYKATPQEVKFIMIDPKVVELNMYNGIPHLLIPVVTDPKKAANALNWGVREMERRYKEFAAVNVKNCAGYNEAMAELEDREFLPQIVIIVDELADLMMTAAKEVEEAICRLAQMARAAGIHLVIATQRPSVNVITGLIKANIPSRLAFAVTSGVDSRTILDSYGAEHLLGKGDMLFHPLGVNKAMRIQGAFISAKESENVVNYIKGQYPADYDPSIEESITTPSAIEVSDSDSDEFLEESIEFLLEKDKASVSMLQRQFRIGYNRAARIIEELENRGIVGPEDGAKPRKVLMKRSEWEAYKNGR